WRPIARTLSVYSKLNPRNVEDPLRSGVDRVAARPMPRGPICPATQCTCLYGLFRGDRRPHAGASWRFKGEVMKRFALLSLVALAGCSKKEPPPDTTPPATQVTTTCSLSAPLTSARAPPKAPD